MQISFRPLGKLLSIPFWVVFSLLVVSCSSSEQKNDDLNFPNSSSIENDSDPATKKDIYFYNAIGTTYVCNALKSGLEFPKAVGIAAATYTQVLNGRHGGRVTLAGEEKLSNKRLFSASEFQVVAGALEYCPKQVPKDIRQKVEAALEEQKKTK